MLQWCIVTGERLTAMVSKFKRLFSKIELFGVSFSITGLVPSIAQVSPFLAGGKRIQD